MICKEELCELFKNLSPYKRIDYMCSLLHMCLPLEVRFIGSVLEEYGRKDYYYLRDAEIKANTPHEVSRLTELGENAIYAGLNVYLCLLHSSNFPCSKLIFEILDTCLRRAFDFSKSSNPKEHEKLLLALSLAVHHPAFSFYQKTILYDYYAKLELQIRELDTHAKPDNDNTNFNEDSAHVGPKEPVATNKVVISDLDIRDIKKRSERKAEFKIQVTWSNNEQFEITKTSRELMDFQIKLKKLFPNEVDVRGWKIPYLHGNTYQTYRDERENPMYTLQQYFSHIIDLPQRVLESDLVTQFFGAGHSVKVVEKMAVNSPQMISHPRLESPPEPTIGTYPLKSMIVSNSQFSDLPPDESGSELPKCNNQRTCVSTTAESQHWSNRQDQNRHMCSKHGLTTTQHRSPAYSPMSSSTDSPSSSRPCSPVSHNSVASVTQLLKLLNLDKYSSTLSKYTVEQLASLTQEELSAEGLPMDCQQLLQSKLENITRNKPFGSKNGIVELCQPGRVLSPPANMMWHPLPPNLQYHQLASPGMQCQVVYITSPSVSSPGSEMGGNSMLPGSGPLSDLASQDLSSECSSTPPSPSQCTTKQRGNGDSSGSDDSEKEKCDQEENDFRRKDLPPGQSIFSHGVMRPEEVTPPTHPALFVEAKPEFSQLLPGQNGYQSDSAPAPVMSTGYPPARPAYIAMRPYKIPQPTHAHTGLPMKNVMNMPQEGGPMKPPTQTMLPQMMYPVQQVRSEYPTNIIPVSVNNSTGKSAADGLHRSQTFMMGHPLKGSSGGVSWSGSSGAGSNTTTSTCTVQSAYHSRHSPGPAPVPANPNGGGLMLPAPSVSPPDSGVQAGASGMPPGLAASSQCASNTSNTTRSAASQSPSPTQPLNSSSSNTCDSTCGSCDCQNTYPPTSAYPQYNAVPPIAFWPLQTPPHLLAQGNGIIAARMPPNMYGQIPSASFPNGMNPEYMFQPHPNFKYLPPGVLPMSYMYGCSMLHNSANKQRNQGCYNCGAMNHKVQDCKEKTMESLSGFHLNYKPKSDSD